MRSSSRKILFGSGIVIGVSILTALFVIAIQLLASNILKKDNGIGIEEYFDSENIYGYIVADNSEIVNNGAKLDKLMSDDELKIFNEDGFVRVDDFTDSKNEVNVKVDNLLVDFSSSQYAQLFNGLSDATDYSKIYFNIATELPYTVKLCSLDNKDKPCIVNLKNSESASSSQVKLYLNNENGNQFLQVQPDTSDNLSTSSSIQSIGKGFVDLEIDVMR